MFLPWSLITGRSKSHAATSTSARRGQKNAKALRRSKVRIEALEDRVVPANYFVDASFAGTSTGTLTQPFKTIQDALIAANNNAGPDNVYVYGNTASNGTSNPSIGAYVWTHDEDNNGDGLLDGNMDIGTDATNPVAMYFRASVLNTASFDGSGGAPANLIVKMRDNLVDVHDGSQLRLEGSSASNRVIFTSILDDSAGGDSNGDGQINAPQRTNWGGIRFRAESIDQGATSATGSFVNFADIRYTGETLFDEVVGFPTEFGSIRMEANATNPANVRSAQVRVWNTLFQHGGRALDVNVNALGDGGKATSVITGPDLGDATNEPLTFVDNSINGCFVFVSADFFTGFLQQLYVNTTLDDVGVPYVLTNRLVIGGPITTPSLPGEVTLTFNEGTILKSQNTGLDGIDFGEPNDRTFGTIKVNGSVNRPVLFTSLTDDTLVPGTDLASLYNNGSADTNNDGSATIPAPGDWGGIRIAQGNIDHALVRFGGGYTQVNGTFVNWPAIRVFARDLTPAGGIVQQVRISNTEVTGTFSQLDPNVSINGSGVTDSPGIDLFSRDDGDTRFAGPFSPIIRTGDVQVMDNYVHDNQGKAIQAHPLYFHDARNSLGGYGVYMARNIIESNASNGVFVKFLLNQSQAIDQNLPSAGGVFDDSDIVHVIDGQALIVHPDQFFQMMSQRGVLPDPTSGGYLQKFTDLATFLANLKLRLPGNLPTDVTKPLDLPLQQGPLAVNPGLVDSGLFYYLTNFDKTSRNVTNAVGTSLRGEEWRDWGVNFNYNGDKSNLNDPFGLYPFVVSSDPNNATGRILSTDTVNGDGSFEMVFPDQVSAIGFYINNNTVTSPNEKIELFAADGRLIDSAPLPTTAPGGRAYFARITRTPIYRVRVTEDAGDNTAASSAFNTGAINTPIPDNGSAIDIPLNVGSNFTIQDVNVNVNIIHARAADLQLDLVAPDGTVVPLAKMGAASATGANFTNTYFDDSASISVDLGIAPFTGSFYPTSFNPFSSSPTGLSVLNGKNAQGTWKLRVRDGKALNIGSVTNFSLTFKSDSLPLDSTGISGLAWVQAPASLVVKANSADTEITAGGVQNGYAGITQNAAGVITNGFVPQMANQTTGTNASGMFTFGQSTTSSFTATGPVSLVNGGSTLIPINVPSDFVAYDMTLRLNLAYNGNNVDLRVRLRAPDGTEIDLVSPNQAAGSGFTNTTFDDQTQLSFVETPNLTNATVQSSSFSTTRTTNPSLNTPFGMSFFRGKSAKGTWVLVIDKVGNTAGTFNNATLNFRGMTGGWGSTLRILGQGNAPVILTGIQDDNIGAGPVGHVQHDNGSDGPTTASPGQWRGVRILPGVNSNISEVVTQNPNGTLNRRYADLNPYTRGDEGLTYPGLANPNGVIFSTQDDFTTALSGLNAGSTPATRAPFDVANKANVQDGTLIEYSEIRFAQTGIDERVYPRNKLTIDGNEWEPSSSPPEDTESNPNNALIQPTPLFATNERNQIRFQTIDGTYKVAGRAGGTGDSVTTTDVDWYQLDNPSQGINMYIDLESGARTNGNDEPTNRKFDVAVYDSLWHLLYWTGHTGGYFSAAVNPNGANSGNSLGPIQLLPGDQTFDQAGNFQVDAKYIAVMPVGRVPRSFIDSTIPDGQGQPPTSWTYTYSANQASPAGADGGQYVIFDTNGNPVNPTQDWPWDPPGFGGVTPQGGYEMTLRMNGFERHLDSPRASDGQILIRSNTITNSAGDGISLSDSRTPVTVTTLGANMPLQAARFPFNATNKATNSNGNVYRNEDVNTVNPQFSAPANFVVGPTIQNNLIIRNGGDGISLREDRNTNNVVAGPTGLNKTNPVPYSSNTVTPTAFTQIFNNTIDGNSGNGISLATRGGPTVENNIVSNNSNGLSINDGYDILNNTPAVVPAVSYNIFYNNGVSGTFTGANNIIGNGAAQDPQFIDPPINDYRVRVSSPAVDSAISDLQDRLRSSRFPQIPTRAPGLDLRGRPRIDNSTRPNVGSGAFPFYDRGALETNELALRVIGLSVLTDNGVVGSTVSTITITFSGRVDAATFNTTSVQIHKDTPTGVVVPYLPQLTSNTYDSNTDTHTWTLVFASPLTDGTYYLVMDGTSVNAVKDIASQLLDGEFPAPYKLPSGNGAPGGTFQYPFTIRTGTISGTIWRNDNGNGTIDAGEPGLTNVTVVLNGPGPDGILFNGDDEIIATTTSGAGGAYTFINLASGRYYVTVDEGTLPAANYRLNTPPAAKVVNLPVGGVQINLNFGYWIDNGTVRVTGKVFNDINGNGIADPGETAAVPGGGVQVTLTSGGDDFNLATTADNVVYTAFTDTNGNYVFQGTALNPIYGNVYQLDVNETLIPSTFVRTSPVVVPVNFSLTPGGSKTQNYGYQEKQATITGLVFGDADGSGTFNGAETGIANVNVSLLGAGIDGLFGTADDLPTLNTTTTASGNYSFFPLTAGKYRVIVDSASPVLANYFLTTNNATQNLTLNVGNGTFNAANVGYRLDNFSGQIAGLVFNDVNGNALYDLGEPGISGVNVQLRWAGRDGILNNSDDQIFNAVTNGAGAYSATGLPVGDFYLQPTSGIPAGFGLTGPATIPQKITLGFGGFDTTTGFFGYIAANSTINGFVFNDVNGDGVAGGTEAGRFAGVRVFIDANNNNSYDAGERSAFSAAGTGAYTIGSLPAGTYRVMIDTATLPPTVPTGFAASTGVLTVNVPASSNVNGINLGLQQRNALVTGRVFLDLNNNGQFDANEVGSPGQTVTLTFTSSPVPSNFTNPQTTTTASDGTFTFAGLPAGNYSVLTTVPTGGTVGGSGNPQAFSLTAGASASRLFPVQFPGTQTAGVWYFTFAGASTTLTNSDFSTTVVNDTDIVRLTAPEDGVWHYDVFFHGSQFGLSSGSNEGIDAFTFTNTGDIIISTRGTFAVSTNYSGGLGSGAAVSGFGEDLLRFTPSAPNAGFGLQDGSWSLFFKGSKVGLSGASENVDAVSLIYSGTTLSRVLLSTSGTALVNGGISANPQDVLAFKPTTSATLGANTAGTFSKFFVGSSRGLSNPTQHNIDALFYLPNASNSAKPSLFMSTAGNFSVPVSLTGNSGDILRFNATGGGPTGLLTGTTFNSVALRGSDFGHSTANVTGFWLGATGSDPDPLGSFGGVPGGPSFISSLISAPAGISTTPVVSNTSSKTAVSSSSLAQNVSTSNAGSKVVSSQADQFFATAKRHRRTSVSTLADNLLARLK